jgi:hypothetical protein
MLGQGHEARPDHWFAQNLSVLLGHVPAGAKPAARCHDNGGDPICHGATRKMELGHGFSAFLPGRKPDFAQPLARS